MTDKIGGPKGRPTNIKGGGAANRPTVAKAAPKPAPGASASVAKRDGLDAKKASTEKLFPRQAWQDGEALAVALDRAKTKRPKRAKKAHPKKVWADRHRTRPGNRPIVVARYGMVQPKPTPTPGPIIVARYGMVQPKPTDPNGPVKPGPIVVARYGMVQPKPTDPNEPVKPGPIVVARYGLPLVRPR